jgi:hypothetical protein
MANAVYPLYKQALLDASSNTDLNDLTVKVALIDTGTYTYNAAHEFYSSVSGVVGTPQTIANTTVTNGLFDGDNVTFTSVTGNSVCRSRRTVVTSTSRGTPAASSSCNRG